MILRPKLASIVVAIALVGGHLAAGAKKSCCRARTFRRQELFAHEEGEQLVKAARSHDPNFTDRGQGDRDKAIASYERAIEAQPGAPINAQLARRIAELYAYYEDRGKGTRARPADAVPWWRRAIELSNPRQILWAEAQMGLGSSAFLSGDPDAAVGAFKAVLDVDPDRMDLPNWLKWPAGDTKRERALLAEARACLRERAQKARLKAVDNIHYTLVRRDGAAMIAALLHIAKTHAGTPAADRAAQLAMEAVRSPSSNLYRYRGLPAALKDDLAALARSPEPVVAPTPQPGTSRAAAPGAAAPEPTATAVAKAQGPQEPAVAVSPKRSGLGPLRTLALLGGCLAAAVAVGAWLALRRGPSACFR